MSATGTELEWLRDGTGWFCHKLPGRSPQCAGEIFPVCFRCAGVQLGMAVSYVSLIFSRRWQGRFPSVKTAVQCALLMLPLVIDGIGNALGFWNSPGWFRGLTGLGVGLSLPWLLAPLAQPLEVAAARAPSLKSLRQLILPALAGIVAVGLLGQNCPKIIFHALAWLGAAGWCLFLGHFVLALVRAYGGAIASRSLSWFQRTGLER